MDVTVVANARVGVVELSAAGQAHGHEWERAGRAGFHAEGDARDSQAAAFAVDDEFGRVLHRSPELHNVGVLLPPAVHHVLDFLVWQVFQRAADVHPAHGPYPALVAQGQGGNLAALAVAVVRVALDDGFDRDTEHLCCCGFVNFARGSENVQHPFLPGLPGNQPGFDGRKVGINEHRAGRGDQRCAYHLAEHIVDVAVDHLQRLYLFALDELAHLALVLEVGSGQVLHLEQSPCPSARSGSAVELQGSADAPVEACGRLDGVVLSQAGFTQALAKLQHTAGLVGQKALQGLCHRGFLQIGERYAVGRQPAEQLPGAVWVVQAGDLLGLFEQLSAVHLATPKSAAGQLCVCGNSTAVHPHIVPPLVPDEVWNLERLQQAIDVPFGLDVADVVLPENLPLGWVVVW